MRKKRRNVCRNKGRGNGEGKVKGKSKGKAIPLQAWTGLRVPGG